MLASAITTLFTKEKCNHSSLNSFSLLFACSILLLFFSSCNYSLFHVTRGTEGISKKNVYDVTYKTEIPAGNKATITYIDKDGSKIVLKEVTGKWQKSDQYLSGQEMLFKVALKLRNNMPHERLSSAITIDGEVFAEHILTGKNVVFRVGFKLP